MNEATESVTTWIQIGRIMRSHARLSIDWESMIKRLHMNGYFKTPDGISFDDPTIDEHQVNELISTVNLNN